jgi:CRISPR system Cascade subunit CasE
VITDTVTNLTTSATTAVVRVYFSRLDFATMHPTVKTASANADTLHKLVMSGYHGQMAEGETNCRAKLGILFTAKRQPPTIDSQRAGALNGLLVQSRVVPNWTVLRAQGVLNKATTEVREHIFSRHDRVNIRTHLNPTIKQYKRRLPLIEENVVADWIVQTMDRHGCTIFRDTLRVGHMRQLGAPGSGSSMSIVLRPFEFEASINDPHAIASAVLAGVGPGKPYGAGLLHVQDANGQLI